MLKERLPFTAVQGKRGVGVPSLIVQAEPESAQVPLLGPEEGIAEEQRLAPLCSGKKVKLGKE